MILDATLPIGAAVRQTMDALNANPAFLETAAAYSLWPNCAPDGKLRMWHYPTPAETFAEQMAGIEPLLESGSMRFPAVLTFLPIRQYKANRETGSRPTDRIVCRLAIVAPVRPEWSPILREQQVFGPLLRPIYAELIRQIGQSPALNTDYALPHDYCETAFPGGNGRREPDPYGSLVAAIEIRDLTLTLRPTLDTGTLDRLRDDNNRVTDDINNILKTPTQL